MAIDYAGLKKVGFIRQKQDGKFSMRIHVIGGALTAEQLKTIYEVAAKYGKGYVHLTSRQAVEIPFISHEDIDAVKADLEKGGCKTSKTGAAVRTVTACQGNVVCRSGNIDAHKLAEELDRRYDTTELPHKFKFGVTGCQNNCLKAEENDIGIKGGMEVSWISEKCIYCGACERVCRSGAIKIEGKNFTMDESKCTHCGRCEKACPTSAWEGKSGYLVSFGGLFGNTINKGDAFLPLIKSEEQLYRVTDAGVEFFKDHGKSGERFKFTIDRIGWDTFTKTMQEAYQEEK